MLEVLRFFPFGLDPSADTEDIGTRFNNIFVNKSLVNLGCVEEGAVQQVENAGWRQLRVTGNEGHKTLKLTIRTKTLTCYF